MQKPLVDIVAIVVSKPLLIGIYKDKKLIKIIKKDGMTSDVLPEIFDNLLKEYDINSIVYTKGPGSFMSIKLSFVFFKTLEVAKGIKLFGVDAFYFNNNAPIKANFNSYFVKKEGIISLEKNLEEGEFSLPQKLNFNDFSEDTAPLYVIKAV